jgi:DNA-binding MarR family transcriptional regulator
MMRRTDRVIYKARQKELDKYGISAEVAAALFAILRLGRKATPAEIARQLFLERHSISEQLMRMEKDGLIRKAKDLDRKNSIRVEVTDKGYEAYLQSAKRRSTKKIMSQLTDEEQEQLWALLARLRDAALLQLRTRILSLYPPSSMEEWAAGSNVAHASKSRTIRVNENLGRGAK